MNTNTNTVTRTLNLRLTASSNEATVSELKQHLADIHQSFSDVMDGMAKAPWHRAYRRNSTTKVPIALTAALTEPVSDAVNVPEWAMSDDELRTVSALRTRGFAVVVYTPRELGDTQPREFESQLRDCVILDTEL